MRRLQYGKFGLAEDPVGLHVVMPWKGRELLGEVMDMYRSEPTGSIHLAVRHFNREPWPIDPVASVVQVLERGESPPKKPPRTKAQKVQIVLAWKTAEQELTGDPWRADIGERPKWKDVEKPHAAMWKARGREKDVEKARIYADNPSNNPTGLVGHVRVLTYPTSERDPLGRAKRDVMEVR